MATPEGDLIQAIRADVVDLPLPTPVAFSTRRLTSRKFLVVRVTTSDGIEGIGYSYGGEALAHGLATELAPVLKHRAAGAIEQRWSEMYQESLLNGRRGALVRAISAVDIALWDILGKRAGLPLYRLLGYNDLRVPAYFSGGYYRDDWSLDSLAAEAKRAVEAGFDSMKIKIGRVPLGTDLDRIGVVRDVLGPGRRLALDANNAWPDWLTALKSIRAMERFDPWWIEEPLSPDDVIGHAKLVERVETNIATGEIEATRWGFQSLMRAGACTIVQPDACVVGGVSEWMKVAHMAAAEGLPVAPHWNADIHVHLAAATANCIGVEFFDSSEGVYNFDLVLQEPLTPSSGFVSPPERAGVGLILDEVAIQRYSVHSVTL